MPHWSFAESQTAFGWSFDEYLRYGGYPGAAALTDSPLRWQSYVRDSIIEPALSRDILGQVSIRKPALFRQAFELAMHHPAQVLSLNKMLGQLQNYGNIETLRHYLELMEGAFLLKLLPKYSSNFIVEKRASSKILPLCPALVHAFIDPKRLDTTPEWRGRIVEMIVGAELLKRFRKVSYWRERQNEVDFVAADGEELYAVEVKAGRPRKQSGLTKFKKIHPHAFTTTIRETNLLEFLAGAKLSELTG